MATVKADWLELRVKEYDDGAYEGYEALTDSRCEGDWSTVRNWIERLLDETETAMKEASDG